MIFRSTPLILLLSASGAWANQTPIGTASNGGGCLDFSIRDSKASYDLCCPSGSESKPGKGTIGNADFTYTCGTWATKYNKEAVPASNARECAERCADPQSDCQASTWSAQGKCYFAIKNCFPTTKAERFLFMEKTGQTGDEREPPEGCSKPVEAAKAQCEKEAAAKCEAEKAALGQTGGTECKQQLDLAKYQCEAEKAAIGVSEKAECEKQITEKCSGTGAAAAGVMAQCEKDKASLVDDVQKKCEAEKLGQSTSCEMDKAKLEAEKSAVSTACEAAKAKLEAEKQALQNALDEANKKLTEMEASKGAAGGTSESQTSPENEAIVKQISDSNFANICSGLSTGQTFITVDSKGYKHEWKLHCNTNVGGASTPHLNPVCHTQNIIQLLKEQQERSNFKALWVNAAGVCTPWTDGWVIAGGPFPAHHLILPTRGAWK
jgi:hypothetical protein